MAKAMKVTPCAACGNFILKEPYSQMTATITKNDDSVVEIAADICGDCTKAVNKGGQTISLVREDGNMRFEISGERPARKEVVPCQPLNTAKGKNTTKRSK